MEEEPELVTIALYRDAMEADLAKGRLDSAGITSFLVEREYRGALRHRAGRAAATGEPNGQVDARSILNDPGTLDSEVESVS